MGQPDLWVDHTLHLLHFDGSVFPCDRDVEALARWQDCALLLSSDTDCVALFDRDGLVRTARVGVYPQDISVQNDTACICGGADGRLHLLTLPDLRESADYPLPGIPERIALHAGIAHVLTLLTDPEVHTALLRVDLGNGMYAETLRLPGIPGALTAADCGLWLGVSELALHLPWGANQPDIVIEGLGLPRWITVQDDGIIITDALEEKSVLIRT